MTGATIILILSASRFGTGVLGKSRPIRARITPSSPKLYLNQPTSDAIVVRPTKFEFECPLPLSQDYVDKGYSSKCVSLTALDFSFLIHRIWVLQCVL